MKGLSTEQNVHKSTNIVHDLATLIVLTQPPDSLTLLTDPAHQKTFSGGSGHVLFSSPADMKPSEIGLVSNYF